MFQRYSQALIESAMGDTPVVLLNGARQTGKTTLVQALAGKVKKATYVTLDDAAALAAGCRYRSQANRHAEGR